MGCGTMGYNEVKNFIRKTPDKGKDPLLRIFTHKFQQILIEKVILQK